MAVKDINGKRITSKEAVRIIDDVLATSPEGETFKGAVPQGQEGSAETYELPRSVKEAQAKEIELRNAGNSRAAGQFSQGFLGTIAQKLIYQTILQSPYSEDLGFIERFKGENIDYGMAKEYVATQMSGSRDLDQNAFIPPHLTKVTAITQVNNFLTQQGTLNTASNAFMKQFCMSIQSYATKEYFLSDVKLQQFIQNVKDSLVNGAKLFLYNSVMTMLMNGVTTASTTANGTNLTLINGTATNMFDACIEVCTHIKKMTKLGNKYQLIQSTTPSENLVRGSSVNDLT